MKLLNIRIETVKGDLLHVFDEESRPQIIKQVRQALRAGNVVRWEDGTREWWQMRERVDTTKAGSDQYEWDSAGQKVRADLVKFTKDRAGKTIKTVVPGKHFVVLE